MEMELIAILFCISLQAWAQVTTAPTPSDINANCTWSAADAGDTAILNDLKIPYTYVDVQAYYYESCSATATAHATVEIAGTTFTALPNVLTFANPPTFLIVTYEYPSVTVTSLTPGETLAFSLTVSCTDSNIDGGGQWTIEVPVIQATEVRSSLVFFYTLSTPDLKITTTYATSTFTTTTGSKGVAPAVVGGIAVAIVGALVLLGAVAFFVLFRKPSASLTDHTHFTQDSNFQQKVSVNYPDDKQSSSGYTESTNQLT